MRVLFDHQIFSTQTYGGISRYFFELMQQFETTGTVDFEVGAKLTNNAYLPHLKNKSFTSFFPGSNFRGKGRIMYAYNKYVTSAALKYKDINLVHPTYYDSAILKNLSKIPFVLTCHDLIHEKYQQKYERLNDVDLRHKKLLLESAAAVIAVSENTKRDIIDFYKIPEDKIDVIYLASSLSPVDQNHTITLPLPKLYLLFVGNRALYKNFQGYLKAISPLFQVHKDLQLLCAGGGAFNREEHLIIYRLKLQGQVRQIAVDDAKLTALYQHATAFVFPSLYEGFGIPALEAFSCGCPALLSHTSSLPEVGADAALYFDPTSAEDMSQVTLRLIENSGLRDSLKQKGLARAAIFSWQKTAEQTSQLYHTIA